ncbi:hypothetical protein GH714_007613 [Hevea brasiliensis]|uniref:acid phosphatase n=1 Tax=Hevea brasiliensis TaxID=3981 RepID=A0A6A6LYR9_HEVBR|nr:hypothetical protein GH714_007613 [Hevea brasiliensis]
MGIIGEKLDIDFIISTGDNFYDDGLTGVDDPAFYESFTKIYTAPSLQKQWYCVLGNHDYRGDVEAQLSPVLREMDSKWLCLRSFIVDTEIADFFFVDTTPFVDKYFTEKDHNYDWSGVTPRQSYLLNLLKDLDKSLKESTAKWKIVVGHHTIKSAGHHGNTQELNSQLLPILLENDVDLYINGHDHCLEHISSSESPLQFLTSGGGSKAWKGDVDWWDPKEMKFYFDGQGFMSVEITQTQMGVIGEELNIDFVISTGDNFYEDGLTGVDDPAFYESFTNIYTAPSLQKQWYSVLGNHDYRGDAEAQLNPILTEKDSRWLCLRSFIVNAEIVEFFFVDTSPFVNDYFINPAGHNYDWKALESSNAKWKIVVGHHAILSAGHHGITEELLNQLVPILEKHNVDAYINGHHCMEHISTSHSKIQFLTSGGGSKAWRGDIRNWNPEELKLYYDGQGFMSGQMTDTKAVFVFYDIFGNVLHQWSISKVSHSAA